MSKTSHLVSQILHSTNTPVGEITSKVILSQKFQATDNRLHGVSLFVATYCRTINANVTVTIWNCDRTKKLREVSRNTRSFADNSWQSFYFEPIRESQDRIYWFDITSNGRPGNAITLWTNSNFADICWQNKKPLSCGICFSCCYQQALAYQLDCLLFPNSNENSSVENHSSLLDPKTEDLLHRLLVDCVCQQGHYFLRLAHLADSFGQTKDVETILSVGCGEAYQESFLAGRFPQVRVDATDVSLEESQINQNSFPNIQFQQLDILQVDSTPEYDLVMSIECLEHIQDYEKAFQNMAAKVKPGKYFYLSVPFASKEEQQDPKLCQKEWQEFQHYVPGFSFEDLTRMFSKNGFRILQATNMFYVPLEQNINSWLSLMNGENLEQAMPYIIQLFLLDVANKQYTCRNDGVVGIRFLGQKMTANESELVVG
jgi:SAM-dependent methyltransferase